MKNMDSDEIEQQEYRCSVEVNVVNNILIG